MNSNQGSGELVSVPRASANRLPALLVGLLVVATAASAMPGGEGIIHGCYGERTGALRIVDDPSACRPNEVPLSWSQSGAPSGSFLLTDVDGAACLYDGAEGEIVLATDGDGAVQMFCIVDGVNDGRTWYRDRDGDGYGVETETTVAPRPLVGYSALPGDCDDQDPLVHVNAPERLNGADDDCNGLVESITVSPSSAAWFLAVDHAVTASIYDEVGAAVEEGVPLRFEVYRSGDSVGGPPFALVHSADLATGGEASNPHEATFSYPHPSAGAVDIIVACVDPTLAGNWCAHPDQGFGVAVNPDLLSATAQMTWIMPNVTLTPKVAAGPSGETHTVHMKVVDQFGQPLPDMVAAFEAWRFEFGSSTLEPGGYNRWHSKDPSFYEVHEMLTDANGEAQWTYDRTHNPEGPVDGIIGCVDPPPVEPFDLPCASSVSDIEYETGRVEFVPAPESIPQTMGTATMKWT